MHYVVRSPELRSLICANCGNRSLVALAQTSHDFFATAAPIMWRSLSSLGPLFGCLPQSVAKTTDPSHMALQQQAPQLSSLAITCRPFQRPINLFVGCDALGSLHLSSVDHETVKAIARLPQLQELHIGFPSSLSFDTSAFPERPFASLSSLTISKGLDSTIIAFLSLVSAVSLATVTIHSKSQFPLRSLCESLSKHGANMRQLKIEAEGTDLTCQDVEPLLSCRNLVAVCIIPSRLVKLDGAGLARMAKAWPLLQELWIRTADVRSKHDFPLALADLKAFAEWTPCLRRLSIDFDATQVDALPELDERFGPDETLRSALAYLNAG
ncbi:hypothetical protein K525DRAFT_285406 [Schizophyllum commune Loenen D]|nr:hypothetical protein K525DRAFT_285406 [Schizophyllum commune Loenen D]